MLLLRTDTLPDDRAVGVSAEAGRLPGRRLQDRRHGPPPVPQRQRLQRRVSVGDEGLAQLPDDTVIDGEIVALDSEGRPSFNLLQNYGSEKTPIVYFVFDVMVLAGRTSWANR